MFIFIHSANAELINKIKLEGNGVLKFTKENSEFFGFPISKVPKEYLTNLTLGKDYFVSSNLYF